MKKSKKIIAIILVTIIVIYIAYAIYLLIVNPTDTYIIKQGAISQEDATTAYIIRNEIVIKGENYENGIYSIVSEGEKVAKADSIYRYYSDSEKDISIKINELDYKIQELLEKENNITPPSADIKAIENQIEGKLKTVRTLTNIQEIIEYKNNINNLMSKKIKFMGDSTENSEIKKLIKERNSYEENLKNGAKYITAPMSGVISYRIDGLEEKLSKDNFSTITGDFLNNMDLRTGQIIAVSSECGKVIDNFRCYIAVTMNSNKAMEAKIGDNILLRISNEETDAKIVHINEESGKRTIIFEINKMTEELINHRKIAVDVIWWSESGLKVPNQALIEENGLYYVMRNKAGIETKILVKLIRQTDKFSIISSYSLKDLQKIGYSENEIKNYRKINNYDEILINPK